MDWMGKHKLVISCLEKIVSCVNQEEKIKLIKGNPKPICVRNISALQLNKSSKKGCQLFVVSVEANDQKTKNQNIDKFPIIIDFKDVITKEIRGLPPNIDINFSIYLVL